jgi:phage-related protein
MSFLYDRDYNVTGAIQTTFDFKPSYGTSVTFMADMNSYTTVDNYLYTMPKGVNHLQMTVQMPFENRKELEATKIVSFFENLRGTGYFTFTDPASIYKPVDLFCGTIQNNFTVNDLYTIQVELSTDQIAPLLNWNGMFVTGSGIKGNWATSTSYSKYDVVRHTGNASYPKNTANLYDCFYYCTGDHTSQSSINGSEITNGKWTQEFFYQPTYSSTVNKETSVLKTDLPYSFAKRSDFGLHANFLKEFVIEFKGISDLETRSILHFLSSKQGYRKFQYKIPNIYNKNKYFFAPEWKHTFVYKNVNDISVTLIEDPIGVRRTY